MFQCVEYLDFLLFCVKTENTLVSIGYIKQISFNRITLSLNKHDGKCLLDNMREK